jgi:predicted transcriptional regulator
MESTKPQGRRKSLQIIREILEIESGSRTQVRLSVGLNGTQMGQYVDMLLRQGFLEEGPRGPRRERRIRTTEKGERLLGLLDDLTKLAGFESLLEN